MHAGCDAGNPTRELHCYGRINHHVLWTHFANIEWLRLPTCSLEQS